MTEPVRIVRRRKKGSKMISPNGLPIVYVGRGSKWGNPIRANIGGDETQKNTVNFYKIAIKGVALIFPEQYKAWIEELRGKNLACWCPLDKHCHADALIEAANAKTRFQ